MGVQIDAGRKQKINGFLLGEGVLYLTFLAFDIAGLLRGLPDWGWQFSGGLKYLSVIACFLWQLGRKNQSLTAAQAFVLFADFFLLFTGYDAVGICGFLGVQMCYRMYLCGTRSWRGYLWQCALFFAGIFVVLKVLDISGTGEAITDALAVVYGGMLVYHVLLSLKKGKETPGIKNVEGTALGGLLERWMFSLGLLLLLLCDIHVALYNLPVLPGPFLVAWQNLASVAMWLFYLPSQVLVAICAARGYVKGNEGMIQ